MQKIGDFDIPPEQNPSSDGADPQSTYTPASPIKRAFAWIGVVYMVILVALTTYTCFTGTVLHGLVALLAIPALVGLGIVALISHKTTGLPSNVATALIAGVCWILAAVLVLPGVAGLMANF